MRLGSRHTLSDYHLDRPEHLVIQASLAASHIYDETRSAGHEEMSSAKSRIP